ncbi:MAG: hypothetical protein IJ015_02560 [Ruminococcus sp.]|nr:hypothetical protein [Ruminococcus sp.]
MAKVKCEYCGNFIQDTESTCPSCGAVNENHQRIVDGTPKTIKQLQVWYKTRGLPPEEVTRFFIGKDIKEPKAFGIYEENGTFVVYKNKADGSRAIRYEGTDEAYAVNELYLRLKEEILHQKTLNVEKRRIGNRPGASVYRDSGSNKRSGCFRPKLLVLLAVVFIVPTLLLNLFTGIFFSTLFSTNEGYYLSPDNEIFYCCGEEENNQYEWWVYNKELDKWSLHSTYSREKDKPQQLGDEPKVYDSYYDLADVCGIEPEKLCIDDSREYIDAGHHKNPSSAYYYYDDNLYYFINDTHSSYGNTDNTGWYIYDTELKDWDYYCSENDKEKIGDELWYSDRSYYAGRSYDDIYHADEYLSTWNPSSFEDTSWHQSYESNESAYERHLEEEDNDRNGGNNYDNDSDFDWDAGDNWDSGGTNWDSDW